MEANIRRLTFETAAKVPFAPTDVRSPSSSCPARPPRRGFDTGELNYFRPISKLTRVALSMSVGLRIWILRIPPRQPRLEHVAGESAARSIVPVISAWKMFGNGITKFRASPADNVLLLLR